MNTLTPRMTRMMFISGIAMMIVSLLLSMFNVATVLSAPRYTIVGVPSVVGFEGFLTDGSGQPLTGLHTLAFRIYDAAGPGGGTVLWDETQNGVAVTNGLYAVMLGSTRSFDSNTFNGNRWIGVTVDNGTEMNPRTRVSSVPFALNAENANKIAGGATTNMISLFEGSSCPSGWSEYTAARGRVIVGLPSGGTAAGTVGNALTNLEDRTIATHQHELPISASANGWWRATGAVNPFGSTTTTRNDYYYDGSSTAGPMMTSTSALSGPAGGVSTSNIIPYIQLIYCKLNQ